MQLGFYYDQTRCIGCCTCIVACKDWHDIPSGPASWITVTTIERSKFPDLFVSHLFQACFHCAEPLCVKACSVNTIIKRKEDGVVIVDRETCLGDKQCKRSCLKACPYKAPQFAAESDAKMQKCDLCLERLLENEKPICVKACPMSALDAAHSYELIGRYELVKEADGFVYSKRARPSIVFTPKVPKAQICLISGSKGKAPHIG